MPNRSWLKLDGKDTLAIVKVRTRQIKDQFCLENDSLLIKITDPPAKGKANKKLIKMLRKKTKTEVILESGQKNQIKIFRFKQMTPEKIVSLLMDT